MNNKNTIEYFMNRAHETKGAYSVSAGSLMITTHNMKGWNKMIITHSASNNSLMNAAMNPYQDSVNELNSIIESLNEELTELKKKEEFKKLGGRKEQVLSLIMSKPHRIDMISKALGISNKNVSSQIFYLRSDNYDICKNGKGYYFLND